MNDVKLNDADRERQLDRIIADYACRIDAGEEVDRAELLEQYPDLADLLAEHFEDLAAAEAWRLLVQPENSQIETEAYRTIKTTSPSPASVPSLPSPLTPQQRSGQELFGRYRIEGVLGEGAMGAVYLALDTKLNRRVALKIPKCSQDDPDLKQRFLREARAAATLNHRNICQVYDVDNVGDCHYISMAYIEGKTLSSFTRETKMQQPRAVAQLVYKLAIAMAAAHDKGIVHRDLKPGNIMVDGEQEPVIMDFGLAAMAVSDENTRLTQFGMTLGTPAYMSPEQIDGDLARIDGRSDVFSLGIIFYELLCGQLPFQGSTVTAVWSQIATKEPVAPSQYREDLDSALEATCLTMLAKDPDQRYADMREVAQALKDYLKCSSSMMPSKVDVTPVNKAAKLQKSPEFWRIQRPKLAFGILGLMILLALVIIVRTPYGDLTVTVNDDELEVVIDDDTVEFTDKKWSGKKKARQHQLALKLQGVEIPFDESKGAFLLDGRQVIVKLGNIELKSDRFEVTRDGETVIAIAFVERPAVVKNDDIPQLAVASQPPPRTPLPDGLPGEVLVFDKHTDRVLDVAVSPNGQLALSCSYDGTVRLWEIASGKERYVLRHEIPDATRSPRVIYVGFSHSGKFAYSSSLDEDVIYIWNLQTGVLFRTIKQASTGLIHAAFLAEDSKLIVAPMREHVVRTWDINSAAVHSQFETPNAGIRWFSSNGQFMLHCDGDGGEAVVEFWGCREPKHTQTYSGHHARVSACAVSTDGTTALSGDDKASVHLWNTASGELIYELKGHHTDAIGGLAFSPNGRFAISSSRAQINSKGQFGTARERMIRVWDLETGKQIHQFAGHGSHVHAVNFTPDGRFALSASSDKTVRVWRLPDEVSPNHDANAPPLAVAPFDAKQARAHQEAWAEHQGVPLERTNSIGMRLRLIPPGEFIMGSSGSESQGDERPAHPVRISRPFLIGASEVTVGQFHQFVDAVGYKTEAETDGIGGSTMAPGSLSVTRRPDINWRNWWEGQSGDHPAVNVTWNDAVAFCKWLGEKDGVAYRLPTSAEYEYASRAGTTSRHPFGEQIDDLHAVANLQDKAFTDMFGPDQHAGPWDDGFALTSPVDFFPENNFGVHDMPGNVNEWCSDWFGSYEAALQTDPLGPATGKNRVLRGGHFAQTPETFTSENRGSVRPNVPDCRWGFRVVGELDPDAKQNGRSTR